MYNMSSNQDIYEIIEKVFIMYRNVKRLREKKHLSIQQMAMIMEINERKLMLAENCRMIGLFHDSHIVNLCTHFNVSADALFDKDFE